MLLTAYLLNAIQFVKVDSYEIRALQTVLEMVCYFLCGSCFQHFIRLIPPACRSFINRGISTSSHLSAGLKLTFACPRSVFYNNVEVKQVDVPGSSGAFGILPEHVPTIATLRPGVVAVTEEAGATKKYFGILFCWILWS